MDFSLQQEILYGGKWLPVVRYDSHRARGFVHVHLFTCTSEEPISVKKVAELDQMEEGCNIAQQGIYDAWAENRRRFLEGGERRGRRTAP